MSVAPLSIAPPHRGDVSPSDFSQGCILFIKRREHVLDTHLRSSGIKEEGLRHPALVIQKEGLRDSQITICPLTTFQGRSIDARFPRRKHHWKRAKYLPMHPQIPLVHGGIQLLLANGVTMMKPGYLCIGQIYTVHISMLRRYDWNLPADHFRLCKQSLLDVLTTIHQHHPGLSIMFETVSPVVAPSSVATLRQDSTGSRIGTIRDVAGLCEQRTNSYAEGPPTYHEAATVRQMSSARVPLLRQQYSLSSYQTLPRYITYKESVTRIYTTSYRSSRTVLEFCSRIVRNIGFVLSWALGPCLHFLRRNYGNILFLLAASTVGVGAVFGIIWIILVCHGLAAAGQWVTGK